MLMTAPLNPAIYFPGVANANGDCFVQGYTFKTSTGATCSTTTNTDSRRILSLIDAQRTGQWVGALAEYQSVGGAKYNGLLLDVRKRAARGVTVSSNYTWSHCVASERMTSTGRCSVRQTLTFALVTGSEAGPTARPIVVML